MFINLAAVQAKDSIICPVFEHPGDLRMGDQQGQPGARQIAHRHAVDVAALELHRDARPVAGGRFQVKLPLQASAASLSSGMPSPTLRVVRVVTKGLVTLAAISASMP